MSVFEPAPTAHTSAARRIIIIGTSGCGKTYVGRRLAECTGYEVADIDDFYWMPGWQIRPDDEFKALLSGFVAKDSWIVTGNYSKVRELLWPKAEMILWLDFPLYRCLWQACLRTLKGAVWRTPCCNGNYESISRTLSKDSILLWVWNTYERRKKRYEEFFSSYQGHCRLLRLKSRAEVDRFLRQYTKSGE